MKKVLILFGLILSVGLAAQTPYDTVNVYDPQAFTEMTTVDPANAQVISRKNNLNRRINLDTLRKWITPDILQPWAHLNFDTTGNNSAYWDKFVSSTDGTVWFIDDDGDGKLLHDTEWGRLDTAYLSGSSLILIENGSDRGTVPDTFTIALTGLSVTDGDKGDIDVSGSGATWNIDTSAVGANEIASTAVTPASYTLTNLTVDADGRITAASNGTDPDFAANGLTMSGDSVILGGALNKNTTITGGNYGLNTTRNNSGYAFTVQNLSTGGGISSTTSSGSAVYGNTATGYGVSGYSSNNGIGVQAWSNNGVPLDVQGASSLESTAKSMIQIVHQTSDTTQAGFGADINFTLESASFFTRESGYLRNKWTTSTDATRTSSFEIGLVNSSALGRKLALAGNGQLTLDGYANTGLTSADSSVYILTSDATGDVWKASASAYTNTDDQTLSISNDSLSIEAGNAVDLGYMNDTMKWHAINRCGFVDVAETTISFDESTKVFTLTDAGGGWSYFREGRLLNITGNKSIDLDTLSTTLSDGDVVHIWMDNDSGTLEMSEDDWTLLDSKIPVAEITWNSTLYPKHFLADERHQALMDRRVHAYLHSTRGTQLIGGGVPTSIVVTGASDDDNTFGITATTLADEDLFLSLDSLADGSGANGTGTYLQIYHVGGAWVWDTSDVPFVFVPNSYIRYDDGTDLVTGQHNRYYNTYLLYTNFRGQPRYVMVSGRSEFTTTTAAYAENPAAFTWTDFPITEAVIAYQFTWQSNTSYAMKGKVRLARAPQKINQAYTTAITPVMTVVTSSPIQGSGTIANPIDLTDGDYGDIDVTGGGTVWTIDTTARNTDAQTLSTSRDTITISTGNSVRTPGVGFLRDSITGAALTIDLKKYGQAVVEIRMESCTSTTLTVNNPWSSTDLDATYPSFEGETGVYTFHFLGISGTDNITWPATFLDMNGTALGTDALTTGTAYTCYYNPVAAKYYCK